MKCFLGGTYMGHCAFKPPLTERGVMLALCLSRIFGLC